VVHVRAQQRRLRLRRVGAGQPRFAAYDCYRDLTPIFRSHLELE
jgi:hypothetical protein